MSLAFGDNGDANAASAKAALGLQHAETFALREKETAEAAREVLNEVPRCSVGAVAVVDLLGVGGSSVVMSCRDDPTLSHVLLGVLGIRSRSTRVILV